MSPRKKRFQRKLLRTLPPQTLVSHLPVAPEDSPWWRSVMQEVLSRPGIVGTTLTVEELSQMVPCYGEGKHRPAGRTVVRRLRPILELISRGPNGALGHGSVFRIKEPPPEPPPPPERAEPVASDDGYLEAAYERIERLAAERDAKKKPT